MITVEEEEKFPLPAPAAGGVPPKPPLPHLAGGGGSGAAPGARGGTGTALGLCGWAPTALHLHRLQRARRSGGLCDGTLLYYLGFFCQLLNGGSVTHGSRGAVLRVGRPGVPHTAPRQRSGSGRGAFLCWPPAELLHAGSRKGRETSTCNFVRINIKIHAGLYYEYLNQLNYHETVTLRISVVQQSISQLVFMRMHQTILTNNR